MSDYFVCPNCGVEVPRKSKACPECGSDENTGWSEFTYMDTIQTPDENEYMELLNNEFSEKKQTNKSWIILTGIFLLTIIVYLIWRGIF
jgi:RNA polymerase subunit RPABC4/transcription elongation factor Spt4